MRSHITEFTDQQICNFFDNEFQAARAAYRAALARAHVLARQLNIDVRHEPDASFPNIRSMHSKGFARNILNAPQPTEAEIQALLASHLFMECQEVRNLAFMESYARQYPEHTS